MLPVEQMNSNAHALLRFGCKNSELYLQDFEVWTGPNIVNSVVIWYIVTSSDHKCIYKQKQESWLASGEQWNCICSRVLVLGWCRCQWWARCRAAPRRGRQMCKLLLELACVFFRGRTVAARTVERRNRHIGMGWDALGPNRTTLFLVILVVIASKMCHC